MKHLIAKFLVFTIVFPLQVLVSQESSSTNLAPFFSDFEGCFLLFNLSENRYDYEYNTELSDHRFSPCSTFKIPNSLIALEERVIEDENTYLPWDKTPQFLSTWEKDHNLSTAIEASVVWFYQAMAQKVGMKKYESYLSLIEYGNQNPKSDLSRFWLQDQ
jgi:beta-lactamase class D